MALNPSSIPENHVSDLTISCSACGYDKNTIGSEYCDACGSELTITCPACLIDNPSGSEFCLTCGAELNSSSFQYPLYLPINYLLKQGQYKIEAVIGQGGFTIAYKAINLYNQRKVFIKELLPERSVRTNSKILWPPFISNQKSNLVRTFLDEAKFISRCIHPNIVRIYDWFEENNTAYIIMSFIQGKSLYTILAEEGPLSTTKLRHYFSQIAEALKVVHSENILHRDVKPDNIIVDENDRPILIDFGAAREYAAGITQKMTVILTPGYAPLEQYALTAKRSPSSDIYSLCASMYELATGQMPVAATDRVLSDTLIPPRQLVPNIEPDIEQLILKGMQIKVADRYQNMDEFINALNSLHPFNPSQVSQETISPTQLQTINVLSPNDVKIESDTKNYRSFSPLSARFSLIGDRNVGKTTYLAALANLQNTSSSIIQSVVPVNSDGYSLIDLAQNIIAQGLLLEPTRFNNIDEMNHYSLSIRVFLKKQFSWKNLLNIFLSNTNFELNILCKDYAGEFFSGFIDRREYNSLIFQDYIADILDSQSLILFIDSQSRQDEKDARTIYEFFKSIDTMHKGLLKKIAVILAKSDLLKIQLNKYAPDEIVSSRFPQIYKQLQTWKNRGNQVEYFYSSAFGFLDQHFYEPNSVILSRSEYGVTSIIKDPARWKPFGLVSPIYWLCTGKRYKELDFE
ncbi:serine/threonine-protein kinase [Gloeothece verrucosa]|uniref:Serine/threonine protein kinase n=1 Tax=Gloeothece verrucosa (strain PCC 7822) TaxID=497965 RepID=E0UD34_GLOV7|nr:serine/threonine-protein kinase [Gloeothece verrucosa]ADN12914.1 serine/threonine protein kinase [Gloeothece verrucosa PCC 7822]